MGHDNGDAQEEEQDPEEEQEVTIILVDFGVPQEKAETADQYFMGYGEDSDDDMEISNSGDQALPCEGSAAPTNEDTPTNGPAELQESPVDSDQQRTTTNEEPLTALQEFALRRIVVPPLQHRYMSLRHDSNPAPDNNINPALDDDSGFPTNNDDPQPEEGNENTASLVPAPPEGGYVCLHPPVEIDPEACI